MAADGSIVIETDIKTEKLRNKLAKLNNDIERQNLKVSQLTQKYNTLLEGGNKDELESKLVALNNTFEKQSRNVETLERKYEELWRSGDTDAADSIKIKLEKAQIEAEKTLKKIEEIENAIKNGESSEEIESARLELIQAQNALSRMETDAAATRNELSQATGGVSAMRAAADRAKESFGSIEKRIKTIAKKVFIFTLISSALRKLKSYLGDVLEKNEDFQASLATLKGALLTAAQPILDVLIPALKALVNILALAASYLARFMSFISGKSIKSTSKAAKATYEQAKATEALGSAAADAQKQMSGLDEMNTWQSSSSSGGSSSDTGDVDFGFADEVGGKMGWLEGIISAALFAVGAILLFSGASIPLGLGLMIVGAMGVAAAVKENWGAIKDKLGKSLDDILTIGGALLVGVGAVLAFTGANLPLGIGLLAAGVVMLASAVALNWGTIKELLQGEFGEIMAVVGTALVVLGLLLALSGVNIPLGLALIATGAVSLAAVIAANWDSIVNKVKSVWQSVKDFWNAHIAPIFTRKWWADLAKKCVNGFLSIIESGINGMIGGIEKALNWIVKQLNKLSIKVPDALGGGKIGFDLDKVKLGRVEIPRLAQGAVIPANREFLAVLGDQKTGRNLEAPEELIRQIVREESGGGGNITYEFVAQLDGRTIFKEVVDQAKLSRRMTGKNPMLLGG